MIERVIRTCAAILELDKVVNLSFSTVVHIQKPHHCSTKKDTIIKKQAPETSRRVCGLFLGARFIRILGCVGSICTGLAMNGFKPIGKDISESSQHLKDIGKA